MSKKNYSYQDVDVTYSGNVTVVNGELHLSTKLTNKLLNALGKLGLEFNNVVDPQNISDIVMTDEGDILDEEILGQYSAKHYSSNGYSRCHADDKYDAKTGLIIASRKAELKVLKEALRDMTELETAAYEFLKVTSESSEALKNRIIKIETYLDSLKNLTKE